MTQANGDNPTIHVKEAGDFGVITRDKYTDVAVSLWVTAKNINDRQGIFVKFADGKHMILDGGSKDKGLYWVSAWNQPTVNTNWEWVDDYTDALKEKLNTEGGIKLTLVRCGNMLYTLLDDEFYAPGTYALPAEYAEGEVQVGFWSYGCNANAVWKFAINSVIPSQIPSYTAPTVSAENGSVEFDKASYKYGETVTITVTPDADYILSSLIVCDEEVKSQVVNNAYTFTATKAISVTATFAEYNLRDVNITVNGLKMGETVQLNGTVTLINGANAADVRTVTLTNGEVTVNGLVTPGTYKVVFENEDYYEGTFTLAKGATTATVTLQYKRFEAWANGNLDRLDLSEANSANPSVGSVATGDLGVITRDSYDDVSVSVWLKSQKNSGDKYPHSGLLVRFEDGGQMILRLHNYNDGSSYQGQQWLRWEKTGNPWGQSTLSNSEKWANQKITDEQKNKFDSDEGVKLTLVRRANMLYVLLDDSLVNELTMTLDSKYATGKVQVGFWEMNPQIEKTWKFDISDKIPTQIPTGTVSATFANVLSSGAECVDGCVAVDSKCKSKKEEI